MEQYTTPTLVEFKSAWNNVDKHYCRIGDSSFKLECDIYRKSTPEDLSGLNIEEKKDLIERAHLLTNFINGVANKFVYKETLIVG